MNEKIAFVCGVLRTCVLCGMGITATAYAEAPIEDYSTTVSSSGTTYQAAVSTTTTANTPTASIPSNANAAAAGGNPTKSESTSLSIPNWPESGNNEDKTTAPKTLEERVRRIEQQVGYLNKNNSQTQMEDLQQRLQKITGELELQQHKLSGLEKQLDDFYIDLDKRIKDKESNKKDRKGETKTPESTSEDVENKEHKIARDDKENSNESKNSKSTREKKDKVLKENSKKKDKEDKNSEATASSKSIKTRNPDTSTRNSSDNNYKNESRVIELKKSSAEENDGSNKENIPKDNLNSSLATDVASTATAPSAATAKLKEQQLYQTAFDLLQNRKFKEGEKKLKEYLATYSSGTYAANAHYWLGEIYFLNNSYPKASTEFDIVASKYPSSPKLPEAMFKLAYIHDKEGKREQAQKEYRKLKKNYPNSAAAQLAEQQLQMTTTPS